MYNEICEGLDTEFFEFKADITTQTPEEIFDNAFQINAYDTIHSFFEDTSPELFTEECIGVLHRDRKSLISLLYSYYLKDEYSVIDNSDSILELVQNYAKKYYIKKEGI